MLCSSVCPHVPWPWMEMRGAEGVALQGAVLEAEVLGGLAETQKLASLSPRKILKNNNNNNNNAFDFHLGTIQ